MADMTSSELRAHAGRLVAQGDLEAGSAALRHAVEVAAAELADAHGMLGGVSKRAGDLVAAIRAYDAGFEIESRYGLASYYNTLNRLVTRILHQPACLAESGSLQPATTVPAVDVPAELTRVRTSLAKQAAEADTADRWTFGDLAVVSALTGDRREMASAVQRFDALTPTASERARYRETAAGLAVLDTPRRHLLTDLTSAFLGSPDLPERGP